MVGMIVRAVLANETTPVQPGRDDGGVLPVDNLPALQRPRFFV